MNVHEQFKATVAARRAERRREWAQKAEDRSARYFEKLCGER